MRIGKRLFPYPTVNNSKVANCFKETTYALEYEDEDDGKNLILKNARISLNNHRLANLMRERKAEAVVIVECSATIFRKTYNISLNPTDIKIPLTDLRDQVVISSFIYAREDINYYSDDDFLEDYENYSFNIEKYDILAIDDGFTTKVDYDDDKDKKISSIFSIIKSSDEDLKVMKVNSGDRKIIIYLPSRQFDYYDNMKRNDNFQNIFFSIITIPALIQCLQKLQNENIEIELIKLNHSWFESITSGFKKIHGYELTDDEFSDMDVAELSQELMNYGSVNAIEDFFNIMMKNYVIGGYEDE